MDSAAKWSTRIALAVVFCAAAGLLPACSGREQCNTARRWCVSDEVPTWGVARPRIEFDGEQPVAVIIDIHIVAKPHSAATGGLYEIAEILTRKKGVVTIGGSASLHLPEDEGFTHYRIEGDIHRLSQGHDPALSPVADDHWIIEIPLRSDEAKRLIREGKPVIIDLNAAGMMVPRGLAFQW